MKWAAALSLALASATLCAEELPEVRQLVTFDFLPGRMDEALRLFRDEALPLYKATPPIVRFRGFREAESPEPLDLMVVSSFEGMAGMDAANTRLREAAAERGGGISDLYQRIGALSQGHRDAFVEIDPSVSWGDVDATPLRVFISLRIAPGRLEELERLLRESVVPWEKTQGVVSGSESGRYLLSDGWTYFRVMGIGSLGDWHAYLMAQRDRPWSSKLEGLIVMSRQAILVPIPDLSVR